MIHKEWKQKCVVWSHSYTSGSNWGQQVLIRDQCGNYTELHGWVWGDFNPSGSYTLLCAFSKGLHLNEIQANCTDKILWQLVGCNYYVKNLYKMTQLWHSDHYCIMQNNKKGFERHITSLHHSQWLWLCCKDETKAKENLYKWLLP